MRIEILGPGCPRCRATEQVVREQVRALGVDAEVVHVSDPSALLRYRVMFTPAVVVDGELVLTGHVPRPDEVRRVLTERLRQP